MGEIIDEVNSYKEKYLAEFNNKHITSDMILDLYNLFEEYIIRESITVEETKIHECYMIMYNYLNYYQETVWIDILREKAAELQYFKENNSDLWEIILKENDEELKLSYIKNLELKYPGVLKYFTPDALLEDINDFLRNYAESFEIKWYINAI